jgi:hypothetical protein
MILKKNGPEYSKKIIIHMGSSHSTRIEFILQQLKFDLIEYTYNIDNKYCININNDSNKLIDDHNNKHIIFDWLNKYNSQGNKLNIEFFKPELVNYNV